MTTKEELRDKTKGKGTVFKRYTENKRTIQHHHFFEGKDDLIYYKNRIEICRNNSLNKKICTYECGSKKDVLDIYQKIKNLSKPSQQELLFFIDKDFEKEPGYSSDIYVTPCYSIENFFAHKDSITNIIRFTLAICDSSEERKIELEKVLYQEVMNDIDSFLNAILPINAWYSLQINKEHNGHYANLKEFQSLERDILKNYSEIPKSLSELESRTPNFFEITEEEFENEKEWLQIDGIKKCRGKYLEQFLNYKFKTIFNELNQDNNKYGIKLKNNGGNIGENEFLSHYVSCAKTPSCLKIYLKEHLKES